MTRPRLRPRTATVLAVVALVGLALVPTGTGAVATDTRTANESTLAVADTTVEPNTQARVRVSLDEVPKGLAGYEVTLELRTDGVANVTGATYPDVYQPTTTPDVGGDGRTVTLEAADLTNAVGPGATNVTLATVNVSGVEPGTTRLVVTDLQVDADNGSRIEPALEPGDVTVGSTGGAVDTTTRAPGTDDPARTDGGSTANEGTPATTRSQSATGTGSPTGTTSGTGPGFGVGVALVAVAGLALLARRD